MATPLAHVVFCLDCSSSMDSYKRATQEAFNAFVATLQKTKGAEIKLTLVEYRDDAQTIYRAKPIQDVDVMTNYRPDSGYDTLFDVVFYAVQEAERVGGANKTVICILCDGGDTSSKHKAKDAAKLIAQKRAEGWEFCFLAAGKSAQVAYNYVKGGPAMVATKMLGLPEDCVIQYGLGGDGQKTIEAFGASAWNVGAYTSGRAEHVTYTEEQKKAVGG